ELASASCAPPAAWAGVALAGFVAGRGVCATAGYTTPRAPAATSAWAARWRAFRMSVSLSVSGQQRRGRTSAFLLLVSGQVAGSGPLRLRRARVQMQVVLVDVDDLDLRLARPVGERPLGFGRLVVVDGALVVAVVQLRQADEREEARRVDLVHDALGDDLDVVAELFIDVRNAAGHLRHGAEDGAVVGRVLAQRRREAFADGRQHRRFEVGVVGVLLLHALVDPRRHRDGKRKETNRVNAAGRATGHYQGHGQHYPSSHPFHAHPPSLNNRPRPRPAADGAAGAKPVQWSSL